jgi:hypothetical protein
MFKVSEDVLKAVLNYLATKPYMEVKGMVEAIQQSEKIESAVKEAVQKVERYDE